MPLLRAEQNSSRAVAGLHGVAMALGAVLAGLASVALVRRFGRLRVLLLGTGLLAAGVILLLLGHHPAVTVLAVGVIGTGGATSLNVCQSVLGDHHREGAPAALSEANAVAALLGLAAPLAVGLSVAAGWGFRPALFLVLPLAALAGTWFVRAPRVAALTGGPGPRAESRHRLSGSFWLAWTVLVACVAVEFCCSFWAGDLLRGRAGMSAGGASAAVSALIAGMAAGRIGAAWLARRLSPGLLLVGALALAAVGWLLFWAGDSPEVAVPGLLVMGLGVAFHYPMSLSRVIAGSRGQPDRASGLASVAAGVASGGAPFLLGALADRVGTHLAFVIVPVLLAVAAVGVLAPAARRRWVATGG